MYAKALSSAALAAGVLLSSGAYATPAHAQSRGSVRVCLLGLNDLNRGESVTITIDQRFFARYNENTCRSGQLRAGRHTLSYELNSNSNNATNLNREVITDKRGRRTSQYGFSHFTVYKNNQTRLDEYYDIYED